MANIYDYLDYRAFLRDHIDAIREASPGFSYRSFNRKSGMKSSGNLKLVMDGTKNLGPKGIYRICKGLGLSDKEADFFEKLVQFNQAMTHEQKDRFYQDILESYPPKHARVLEARYYKIFEHWYYIAILEMTGLKNFRADPRKISRRLKPSVPSYRVEKALKELEELGLIEIKEDKTVVRTEKMISTPDHVKSLAITKMHEQLVKLSINALRRDAVDDKEYSALMVSLSRDNFTKLKKKIREFRKEIHSFLEESNNGDREEVVCLDMQLFKLTKGSVK